MASRWTNVTILMRSRRPLPLGRVMGIAPVFIVGAPRSGTTLLRLVINAHPALAIVGESFAFWRHRRYGSLGDPASFRRFMADWQKVFTNQSPHPDLLERRGLADEIARSCTYADALNVVMSAYAARENKMRWGEKTPRHVRRLKMIFDAFPEAQVIHLVRDPRAVLVSRTQAFLANQYTDGEAYRFARGWRRDFDKVDQYRNDTARYSAIRYEDLVHDPEPTLRDLCRFLGVDFAPEMLEFHTKSSRYTQRNEFGEVPDIHAMTLESFRADRADRWRAVLSPRHAAIIERVAGRVMGEFGYEASAGRDHEPHRLRYPLIAAAANATVARGRIVGLLSRTTNAARRLTGAPGPRP